MKQYLLGNVGTFAMALLLALVTWTYLFTQGIGPGEVVVEFQPAPLDPEVFAAVEYRTASGETLAPGSTFKVRVDGPKGDVRSIELRPPRTFRCELAVDPKELSEDSGRLKLTLDRSHFTIPEAGNMRILPLLPGGAQITLHYVRFVERTVELSASRFDVEGSPLRGFRVESVTPSIPRIKCRVPADRADEIRQVRIRGVPVGGKQESFTLEWEISAADRQRRVKPVETFRVEVRIVPDVVPRRVTVDLGMSGRPEVLRRVELETKSILLEIQGPEDLVKEAPESAFAPFVVVTERDVQTPGPQNLSELGCHVLDPKYRGFSVIPMADVPPANRTVKIKVLAP